MNKFLVQYFVTILLLTLHYIFFNFLIYNFAYHCRTKNVNYGKSADILIMQSQLRKKLKTKYCMSHQWILFLRVEVAKYTLQINNQA